MMPVETLDHRLTTPAARPSQAGIVLVFSGGAPVVRAMPVDGPLRIGREAGDGGLSLDDPRISRHHCELSRKNGAWWIRDLGSRNGTFVDGAPASTTGASHPASPVVRMGETVALALDDIVPFLALETLRGAAPSFEALVIGPSLRAALGTIESIAAAGENLLVLGESGSGKELAAAHFHASSEQGRGPFVSVNCAAIPEGVAERLLFGAKRGAYSGAVADVDGYVQSADRGVLFLDEIGELDLEVQAKLLRVLETKDVLSLGASVTRRVDVRFCFATHRDLRGAVAAGRFRADLFYRIGQSEIRLPPLRERREEIPWLASAALARSAADLAMTAEMIEALSLRVWPGNVRELLGAVRRAVRSAVAEGAAKLRPDHLDPAAGGVLAEHHEEPPRGASERPPREHPVTREEVVAALRDQPNASAAARHLGIHRSHLYRLMKQFGITGGET